MGELPDGADVPRLNEPEARMSITDFAGGVAILQERRERWLDMESHSKRIKQLSGPDDHSLDDELRMEDDIFALTEGEVFSSIGVKVAKGTSVYLSEKNHSGERVSATFFNFNPALEEGDKFISFLESVDSNDVAGNVGDTIGWMVDEMRDQAEGDIEEAQGDEQKITPQIFIHGDRIVERLKKLGVKSDICDSLDQTTQWVKKGLGAEWISAKETYLFEPIEEHPLLDVAVEVGRQGIDPGDVKKAKLATFRISCTTMLRAFKMIKANPQAHELIELMTNNVQQLLSLVRETPFAQEKEVQVELDKVQLVFMDTDVSESDSES